MKRLAAIAAAVAMIAGAWALRDAIDSRNDDDHSGAGAVPEKLRMTCATGLKAACEQISASVGGMALILEDPGVTADRLAELQAGTDPGFDVWLADGPWAAMVTDDRDFNDHRGAVLGEPSPVMARSPAVIALRSDQELALESTCGDRITWRCIGEQAGSLRVGLSTPDRGDGLVSLAEATASYFDATNYSAADFDEPGFTQWFDNLTGLSRGASLGQRSALATAVGQAGTFNVVGTLEVESESLLRGRSDWTAIYPEPMSTADVQLIPRAGLATDAVLDRLERPTREALRADGWRSEDESLGSGLPNAGVLNALRDRW